MKAHALARGGEKRVLRSRPENGSISLKEFEKREEYSSDLPCDHGLERILQSCRGGRSKYVGDFRRDVRHVRTARRISHS